MEFHKGMATRIWSSKKNTRQLWYGPHALYYGSCDVLNLVGPNQNHIIT